MRRALDRVVLRSRMAAEQHADPDGEVPGLFAVGLTAMLLLPLVLALCAAWLCCRRAQRRRKGRVAELMAADDSDNEEDALRPNGSDESSPSRLHARRDRQTPVYFRKAGDWCSCTRRPITAKVALDGVCSLYELHDVLRRAHGQASARGGARAAAMEREPLALTIEYRNSRAQLVRITRETDLKELSNIKALYVTTKASSLADGSSASGVGSDSAADNNNALAQDDDEEDDDGVSLVSDAASSVLIDLSLAGCSAVRSTHGGLVIAGGKAPPPADRQRARRARTKR